ncbi:MAG: PASTA domain-containing protein [Deltaproteobacteria bacterium]|nr:PASTA domain-containing protein [Deltaproteobacteria bacterium]
MASVRTVLIAAVVTMAILTTSLLAVYVMFTVDVPSVRDKRAEEAKAMLAAVGLGMLEVSAPAGARGVANDQAPRPGARAFVSSVVIVTVGRGNELPEGEPAEPEEERAGPPPRPEVARAPEPKPSTSPEKPPVEAADREVTSKVKVPKVLGKTPEEARAALERAGFALGEVKQGVSEDFKFGVVFSQKPRAGAFVEPGTEVTILVNHEEESDEEESP